MNWISVEDKERLPESLEDVLFTDGDRVYKGYRLSSELDDFVGWYNSNDSSIYEVTHWMPLPELPYE